MGQLLKLRGNRKPNGYSLLELMIVLSIGAILLSVATISLQNYYTDRQIHFFLDKFKQDLYYTQRLAMHRQKIVYLHVLDNEHKYIIGSSTSDVYKKTSYPKHITIEPNTMSLKIVYNKNGNISTSGTLIIKTGSGKFKVVFLLGKGRFYIEEF